MPESMPSNNRRPAILSCVGLALVATALSIAVCHGQKPPDPPDAPRKARKLKSVPAEVRQKVHVALDDDDDDSTADSLPSVSIDPQVFADGMWDLSEVSQCVRAPGDVMVTYPDLTRC